VLIEGTSEGEPDEPLARSAARLCRMAGAARSGTATPGRLPLVDVLAGLALMKGRPVRGVGDG
jgi:hypothetical protein